MLLFYLWELTKKKHTKRHLTLFKIILWLNISVIIVVVNLFSDCCFSCCSWYTKRIVHIRSHIHSWILSRFAVLLFRFSKRNKNILVLAFNDAFVFFCWECYGVCFSLDFKKKFHLCTLFLIKWVCEMFESGRRGKQSRVSSN